jgi:hypothetical protein
MYWNILSCTNTTEDHPIVLSTSILQMSIQDLMCVSAKMLSPVGNCWTQTRQKKHLKTRSTRNLNFSWWNKITFFWDTKLAILLSCANSCCYLQEMLRQKLAIIMNNKNATLQKAAGSDNKILSSQLCINSSPLHACCMFHCKLRKAITLIIILLHGYITLIIVLSYTTLIIILS